MLSAAEKAMKKPRLKNKKNIVIHYIHCGQSSEISMNLVFLI